MVGFESSYCAKLGLSLSRFEPNDDADLAGRISALLTETSTRLMESRGGHVPDEVVTQIVHPTYTSPEAVRTTFAKVGHRFVACTPELGERDAAHLRFEVPDGVFKGSFGHAVAANLLEDAGDFAGVRRFGAGKRRGKFLQEHDPCGVDGLVGIIRMLASDTLSPAGETFGFQFDEENAAVSGDAKTGFEGLNEGNAKFAEEDCINSHK
jgi:hypothetical protein